MSETSTEHLAARAHVEAVFQLPLAAVLELWQNTPDDVLRITDANYGSSLLFYAVQRADPIESLRLTQYLVEERRLCEPAHRDANLQTALFFAARDGKKETCEFLLRAGCDGMLRDTAGQTALFYASREGHCDVIRVLEEFAVANHQNSVNATDKMGQSALFYAAREGRTAACDTLLELGADPSLRDWQKSSAHTYATRRGHTALGAHLKAKSAEARRILQNVEDDRQKVLLQYKLKTGAEAAEWIFPPVSLIEEFEREFPTLAAWSHLYASVYQPMDGFRVEWSQICLDIVNVLCNYKDAVWFLKPVDVKLLNCPDYYDIVSEPRDLSMVRKKLKELQYDRIENFRDDIALIWDNCFRYNPAASPVYKAGQRIKELFEEAWAEKNLSAYIDREANLRATLAKLPPATGVAPSSSAVVS